MSPTVLVRCACRAKLRIPADAVRFRCGGCGREFDGEVPVEDPGFGRDFVLASRRAAFVCCLKYREIIEQQPGEGTSLMRSPFFWLPVFGMIPQVVLLVLAGFPSGASVLTADSMAREEVPSAHTAARSGKCPSSGRNPGSTAAGSRWSARPPLRRSDEGRVVGKPEPFRKKEGRARPARRTRNRMFSPSRPRSVPELILTL